MKWLNNFFNNSNLPALLKNELDSSFYIPEPTRSLIWITDEDTSKIAQAGSLSITITLREDGPNIDYGKSDNYYAEPSLIWKRLPIKKNSDLEKRSMYYPSYSSLSPEHRYQYINWLRDITQPTNLSYVFLYYYGLERHLLIGKYKEAVEETFRLLKYHDRGTFRSYAQNALIVAAFHKKDFEIFREHTFKFDIFSAEFLLIKKMLNETLTANELIKLASRVSFKNKRYINLYPDLFESELEKIIIEYELRDGSVLDKVDLNNIEYRESSAFANLSIPDKVRIVKVPQILSDENFKNILKNLLEKAHQSVKLIKQKN